MENALYFNLNLNDDRGAAYAESKRFLDEYYNSDWPEWKVNVLTGYGYGSPLQCIEHIQAFRDVGAQR